MTVAMTEAQELEFLRTQNAQLKAMLASKLTLKVSDKGGVSLYGMGKWPVTLYRSQWEKLLAAAPQIRAFIDANASSLSSKDNE